MPRDFSDLEVLNLSRRPPKVKEEKATIDFETRSACDLMKTNSYIYARHHTTEIMCMAYHVPGMEKIKLWHPAYPHLGIEESEEPTELFDWIEAGGLVEAHNAFFERMIWKWVAHKRLGWPRVRPRQWRCSAAKAAAHSLPRALEKVLIALGLEEQKDKEGHRLMQKLSKPRKARKAERSEWSVFGSGEMGLLWHEDKEEFKRLWKYCRQDVRCEIALSEVVDDLSPYELKVWQMDQAINERGFWCDLALADAALEIAELEVEHLNSRLEKLTDGMVTKASNRKNIKQFISEVCNVELKDMKAETVEEVLDTEGLSPRAKKVLTLAKSANRTSTKKYSSMKKHACEHDWRIRNGLLYCGADRTGRFSGKGVQPHNFPRGKIKDMDGAVADIMGSDLRWLRMMGYDPMEHLSGALRGALGASPGNEIAVADFAAIEARVVFWLADCKKALQAFYNDEDIYCDMASVVYRKEVTKDMAAERFLGKQAILGLGFGMGPPKFLTTLRKYKVSFSREEIKKIVPEFTRRKEWMIENGKRFYGRNMERDSKIDFRADADELTLCKYVVDVYRDRYEEVKQLWKDQEAAAIEAMLNKGRRIKCGRVSWHFDGTFLRCRLPSGRDLHYYGARLERGRDNFGNEGYKLRYMGTNPKTKQWGMVDTYGGKLVENIVQAIARDFMVHGMMVVHYGQDVYKLILSIHDELVAEKPAGVGSADEFAALMSTPTPWGAGCPIDAKAWVGVRYRKD